MQRRSISTIVLGLCATSLIGCALDEVDPADPAALQAVSSYRATLVRASSQYASNLNPNPQIELWISPGAKAQYDKIRPDAKGSAVKLAQGTLIVRAVYEGGQVSKLTIMGKGEPGLNPVVGDWWFAVTTPAGVPLEDNGQHLAGKLPQCVACHDERGNDDFLFGVTSAAHI